jgi:hypothetical protein
MNEEKGLEPAQFGGHGIRRIWDEETEQWWFAFVDVEAATESNKPQNYWYDLTRLALRGYNNHAGLGA